jgi:DNA-binding LacI/PurR family transcriptional regulator
LGKVTSKEIAKLAGVSVSAVSIVLNNKPGVSDSTRKRILHILSENGIFPKTANLIDNVRGVIRFCKVVKHGGIINDRHNVFISDYIDGVVEESKSNECVVEFATYNVGNIAEVVANIKPAKGLLGCVILSTELSRNDIALFSTLDVPCIFLDAFYEFYPASFSTMDNFGMVYEIVRYLKECGHRRIGMLNAIGCSNFSQRRAAFGLAMEDLELPYDIAGIYTIRSTHSGSYEDMARILIDIDRRLLPSALFACNDMVAIGAMRALQEAGISIPDDISIVGFDDLPASAVVSPPLTSMFVPKYEIGQSAVRLLLNRLDCGACRSTSQKYVIGGSLVERSSVKKLS